MRNDASYGVGHFPIRVRSSTPRFSVLSMAGDWKCQDHLGSGLNGYEKGALKALALPEIAPDGMAQLSDLASDPAETTNLFFKEADKRVEQQQPQGAHRSNRIEPGP